MISNKKCPGVSKKRYFENDLGEQEIIFTAQVLKIAILF